MTDVHPRFRHTCPVSFRKFDSSIERIVQHTFGAVNFDRSKSCLPTYIGVEVEPTDDPALQIATRQFFEKLRTVHQRHFLRFVTDTVWAMESHNGDIFYCHDDSKVDRADVLWYVRAVTPERFEITISNTPDNRRREILSDLEYHLTKVFMPPDGKDTLDHLQDIVTGFFYHTKNIKAIEFLHEDCHIVLTPSECGRIFRPVIVCGLSKTDGIRRWRGIKGQLDYQKHMHSTYFTNKIGVGELFHAPMTTVIDNGYNHEEGFCRETLYCSVEQIVSILHGSSVEPSSTNDIIIVCPTLPEGKVDPNGVTGISLDIESYPLRVLSQHA